MTAVFSLFFLELFAFRLGATILANSGIAYGKSELL